MFASAISPPRRRSCCRSSCRSANRRGRSNARSHRSRPPARRSRRRARTGTNGTSPRRRCASTATPISSAPAAFPSILITGSAGDILIDGGPEAAAPLIASNIQRLGFNLRDVKILLHSHEHFDHVGGIARLQQLTGAQLYASAAAAKVLETGIAGAGDPQTGHRQALPARARRPDRRRRRAGPPRQCRAHRRRDSGPYAGRADLALGQLRRRRLPPDRLCRQPDAGQRRRLPLQRSSANMSPPSAPASPRSRRSTATSC